MAFKKIKLNREGATRLGKKARDMWNENWDRIEGAIGNLDDYLNDWFAKVEQTLADFKAWMLAKFKEQDERIDNLTINTDGNNIAEVVDARQSSIDGTFHTTLRNRLIYDFNLVQQGIGSLDDLIKDQNFNRLPVSEVFSIEHNQYGYPSVRVMHGEYGVGTVPLGTEPQGFGGASSNSVNCDVEYQDMNRLSVKVPLAYAMSKPSVERISENEYILVEGINTLIITIGNKVEANVETFITKTIKSDFTGKIAGSILENGNIARRYVGTAIPSSPPGGHEYGTQAAYDAIKKIEGTLSTQSTNIGINASIPWHVIGFNILWILEQSFPSVFKNVTTVSEKVSIAKQIIIAIAPLAFAKGSGPNGSKISAQVYIEGGWTGNSSNPTDSIAEIGFKQVNPTVAPKYIHTDGFCHLVVFSEASNSATISIASIDYTSIELTVRVPFPKI